MIETLMQFGKGMALGFVRPQGPTALTGGEASLPRTRVLQGGVRYDRAQLARYDAVCGTDSRLVLPPAFPEHSFTLLIAKLVTAPDFPLSPLALIHTRQTIKMHAPIARDAVLELGCEVCDVCIDLKGVHLDFSMEVRRRGELVWEGVATLLSRSKQVRESLGQPRAGQAAAPTSPGRDGSVARHVVKVSGDTGRRFAAATGDYSPHHLWPWTAQALGYKRPMAHGMWTLSRALVQAHQHAPLDGPLSVEAAWKRPLWMPGEIVIEHEDLGERERLDVFNAQGEAPHMKAHLVRGVCP